MSWSPERVQAFEDAKAALGSAALLAHSTTSAPVALTTDASDFAVAAVCEQCSGGECVYTRGISFTFRQVK